MSMLHFTPVLLTIATLAAFTKPAFAQLYPGAEYTTTGPSPVNIYLIDLNGDGKLDAVSGGYFSASTPIWYGFGNGTFSHVQLLAGSSDSVGAAFADLDFNGFVDLVTANQSTNNVTVFLNSNTGFASNATYPAGSAPQAIAAGDVNQDGATDVVIANLTSNKFTRLLGNGTGTLGTLTDYNTGTNPTSIAIGNFSADNYPDVVIGTTSTVELVNNDGSGGFIAPFVYSGVSTAHDIKVRDFNGDSFDDAIVASYGGQVFIYKGNGAGTFGSPLTQSTVGTGVSTVDLADLNSDGKLDIITANQTGQSLTYIPGAAGGTMGVSGGYPIASIPNAAALGDLNGDGRADIVVTHYNAKTIGVYIADATTGIPLFPRLLTTGTTPKAVATADFNLNGFGDIASANTGTNTVTTFMDSNGLLPTAGTSITVANGPTSIVATDLNQDGKPDFATSNQTLGRVSILFGNGAGGFPTSLTKVVGTTPTAIVASDLNVDGKPDLVTANSGSNNLSILTNSGAGAFSNATNIGVGSKPLSVAAVDLNLDQIPDLISADNVSLQISVLLASAPGSYNSPVATLEATAPSHLAVGDMDLNGVLDVIVTSTAGNQVIGHYSGGAGVFISSFVISSLPAPATTSVCDVNFDGVPDLCITVSPTGTNIPSDLVVVDGNTILSGPLVTDNFPAGFGAIGSAVSDLNADGKTDVAIAASTNNNITLLYNVIINPAGVSLFGTGTKSCNGRLGMLTKGAPKINNNNFGITTTNGPKNSLGLVIVTDSADVPGSDPFSLGVLLHTDFVFATEIIALDLYTDHAGAGFAPAGIPNNPLVVGLTFTAAGLVLENAGDGQDCSTSPYHLASTRGLSLTIQP